MHGGAGAIVGAGGAGNIAGMCSDLARRYGEDSFSWNNSFAYGCNGDCDIAKKFSSTGGIATRYGGANSIAGKNSGDGSIAAE